MAGDVLENLFGDTYSLNAKGLVSISEIDHYESYINEIHVISDAHIEVETCEAWTTSTYRRSDGQLVQSDGPTLLPQTISIQKLDLGWFITAVAFFGAPSFCGQDPRSAPS